MKPISKARILALLQPIISLVSGAGAAWLLVHLHVLAIFSTRSQIAEDIASVIVFAVTAGLTWLAHHQRLIPLSSAARMGVALPKATVNVAEILAFITPYLSVGVGAAVAWLLVHVKVLAIFRVAKSGIVQAVVSGLLLAITAGLTWLTMQLHLLPTLFPHAQQVTVHRGRSGP